MGRVESRSLAALRQMTGIPDLDTVIAAHDVNALQQLLAPLALSASVPYADVFLADGAPLLLLRAPELGPDAARRIDPNAADWPPIQRVLRGDVDEKGDRHAGVVFAPWGPLFVSAAPVRAGEALVGVLAVALPLDAVAARLSEESGSKSIALYRPDGTLVVTTLAGPPRTLDRALEVPPDLALRVLAHEEVATRQLVLEGEPLLETIGALEIRRHPMLLLGVSAPSGMVELRASQARMWMTALFGAAIVVAVAVGMGIARQITRPIKV
jgi:hypothetical protein